MVFLKVRSSHYNMPYVYDERCKQTLGIRNTSWRIYHEWQSPAISPLFIFSLSFLDQICQQRIEINRLTLALSGVTAW